MGIFGGSSPKPPPLPPEPAPPPKETDPAVQKARDINRARAALAQGRNSTINTSALGLTSTANTTLKAKLGA